MNCLIGVRLKQTLSRQHRKISLSLFSRYIAKYTKYNSWIKDSIERNRSCSSLEIKCSFARIEVVLILTGGREFKDNWYIVNQNIKSVIKAFWIFCFTISFYQLSYCKCHVSQTKFSFLFIWSRKQTCHSCEILTFLADI